MVREYVASWADRAFFQHDGRREAIIMTLKGRKVLITGTATGIGREIAFRFASSGAEIVAVDWDDKNNQETAAQIKAKGGVCDAVTADVSSEVDVTSVFGAAGAVDVLVNNAASVQGDGYLMDLSGENWDRVLAICLKSVFLCTREVLKSMVPRRIGAIVNLSSANALMGINLAAYTAAKGGILSLTRLTASHYARYGIRANAICPGTITSESSEQYYKEHIELGDQLRSLYPGGQFGKVQDVAACALFLASDESAFINGAVIPVDGALTASHRIPSLTP
jgi:3-oxoacyl-[acyl-carrier protein] reductase